MTRFSYNSYLELLKRTLTGMVYEDPAIPVPWRQDYSFNLSERLSGRDWPLNAHTMIGYKRLNNLQSCIETVISDNVPGDLIETGVWRGGACIFMRGVLHALNVADRIVWVADSFDGFPKPERFDDKALASQPAQAHLAVPMSDVRHNFKLYGLLDQQVRFIPGWFSNTLPGPVKQLSLLRLDSDLYESTMDAITALYPLLSPGGFCIVDDWNVPMCRKAVWDYIKRHVINVQFTDIDGHSIYWRKDA
jgi:hypothetical protein